MTRISEITLQKNTVSSTDLFLIEDGADNNVTKRTTGAAIIAAAPVQSVAGRTGNVTISKSDVGLGSVVNSDTTNASNITSGTLAAGRLPSVNIGTTSVDLTRASGNLSLTGIPSLQMPGATSGGVTLQPAAVAGTTTITLPATTGTVVTTGDSGTVTSTMIANGTIVNEDINSAAAIAGSKISPDFGSQTVTTTGIFSAAAGTAAAPSIAITGDTNTGIYSPGADQIALATGGTGRLFVGSDGNVLIGATGTATRLLTVNQTGVTGGEYGIRVSQQSATANALEVTIDTTNSVSKIFQKSTVPLLFGTNDTERLRIDSSGNVGIGTSSPSTRLDVRTSGSAYQATIGTSSGTAADDSGLVFRSVPSATASSRLCQIYFDANGANGTGGDYFYISNTGDHNASLWNQGGGPIIFGRAATESLRIDSSGKLLAGTSSNYNSYLLQVEGTSTTNGWISSRRNADDITGGILLLAKSRGTVPGGTTIVQSGDNLGQIAFRGADGSADILGGSISCSVDGTPGTNSMPGRLIFATTASGASSPTERLRIDSTGQIEINNLGSAASPALSWLSDTNTGIYSPGADQIALATGGVERLRIDSSGRLLVGTSSARAVNSQTAQHQLEGTSIATSSASFVQNSNDANGPRITFGKTRGTAVGNVTVVASGDNLGSIIFAGANGTDLSNAAASITSQVDGEPLTAGDTTDMPGRLVFSTTADGASSPTERMRITSGGYLKVSDTGNYIGSTGGYHEISQSANGEVLVLKASSASYAQNLLTLQAARNTSDSTFYALGYYNTGASAWRFRVADSGNVTNTNNSYGAISDVKLKENIVDATSQWNDIKALRVRKYNFKEDQTHTQIGLIAQEVELVSPGLVTESPDRDSDGNDLGTTTKSVNYSVLYMKAVKALQEAMERIESLEATVATLTS